ncbi:response regulator [Brucella pseudogrignonensis]|uniref:response regulator n=1 Tax=Brucella pseudogrignonensis TaxID=419475 RepID=UPI00124D28F5|nr:response regulator [Brucella pseudogrignonensis]KAB2689468.1 response regulator [Brucella pseudogrignonensis]
MIMRATANRSGKLFGIDFSVAMGLAAALVFFVVSGLVTYVNFQGLRVANQRIVETHRAIVSLQSLLSKLQDAETGQRGYLLTGEESYLAPYRTALAAVNTQLEKVSERTQDNPGQRERLETLRQHIDAKLDEMAETIVLRKDQGLERSLTLVRSDRGKLEMDAIRDTIDAMTQVENDMRSVRLAEMERAQSQALISTILAALLGIILTLVIGYLLRKATLNRAREEWLQNGEIGLAAAMAGDQPIEELSASILDYLTDYTGAVAGAFFSGSRDQYQRSAVYGVPDDNAVPKQFAKREGLLGQSAAKASLVVLDDVPTGYLSFGSALGRDKPKHLVILPASVHGHVNAVMELGFLQPVDPDVLSLLATTGEAIALSVQAASYRDELQNLLEETQQQSEELQAQGEELRVSNEELEEQSRVLKESQSRLEQQQIELEQTNSQLEEQANQLEMQRTDLERAHASVQLKAQELERSSQYKSDFLANMSHELRTPLNSSLILAKLLADNPDENLTQEQVKYARTIQSSGNDLLNLINDILDLSKIEAGHVEIHPEVTPLARMANGLRQLFDPLAQEKKLDFEIKIEEAIPRSFETDPQRLEQILKNLISNAIKFTDRGKVVLAIAADGDDKILFSVSDSGIGISAEQLKSIFEAFHQADSTISRRYGGTGLGLSISRQLARLLGGSIRVESTPGQGSCFTLTLPLKHGGLDAAVAQAAAPAPAEELPASEQSTIALPRPLDDDRDAITGDKRVLLVIEDDETFAAIVRDLSREMGFHSVVARTAEEAVRVAREFLPNAIVLDVGLPDQSGLSVLDRLKNDVQTRHIPIHVISAGDHTRTAFSLGAVGYLTKPVSREQLVGVLNKLEAKLEQQMHRVLIVEDDERQREAVSKLLGSRDVETVTAGNAAECLDLLRKQTFDCMVLDLSLPDASGFSLLETLSSESAYSFPPVIVYTGRELSPESEQRLRRYSKSIIIKGAKSPERLLDEVSLFLHQIISELPPEQQKMIRRARHRDALLEGRRILVVEDDIRNVYALTNILEPRGAQVLIARNGQEALDALDRSTANPDAAIDLVLMDVMMPVMDGLTATRHIRQNPSFKKLPIITLTAKAMPDDQQRCIEAGANDYMAKPLDVDKLLSLVRVWMPK